jgi:hypothetical protein
VYECMIEVLSGSQGRNKVTQPGATP